MSRVLRSLQLFFLNEYLVKGEQGLPMMMENDIKPYNPPESYVREAIQAYKNKPQHYEDRQPQQYRCTAAARCKRRRQSGEISESEDEESEEETDKSSDDNSEAEKITKQLCELYAGQRAMDPARRTWKTEEEKLRKCVCPDEEISSTQISSSLGNP